jgi:hypothetical protein
VYSRVTQLEIDTLRIGVDEALEVFERDVVPRLREQGDYEGGYVLATPEGRAMLITFWDTEQAADETQFYAEQLAQFVTFFRSPPGRELYEVRYADAPLVAA